jgi:endo-1,4-beta-xylanase
LEEGARVIIHRREFVCYLAALGMAASSRLGQAQRLAASSLKQLAAGRGLLFGSCMALKYGVQSPEYQQLFVEQCDLATPEFQMQWGSLSRGPGMYDYTVADQFVGFCAANHIQVRGHALIWHGSLPRWVPPQLAADAQKPDRGQAMLTGHIQSVARHFRGKLFSWDVVNEVLDPASRRPDGLRLTPWLNACGPDYLALAFRTASVADPKPLLIWNENYLELSNGFGWAKRKAMLAWLDRFQEQNVPIHGIGIQAHLRADQVDVLGDATYEAFLTELAARGLKIFITELDVQDNSLPAAPAARDQAVAAVYSKFLTATLRQPAVDGVVTWGLADCFTWISVFSPRKDGLPVRPLPFDESCRPKPAYFAIAQTLERAPLRSASSLSSARS